MPAFATKLPTDPDAIWDSVIAGLASNTPAIGSHALGSRLMKVWERVSGIKEPYVLTGGVSVGRKDVAKSAFVLANGQRRSKRRLMEVSLGTLRSGITGRLGRGRGGGDAGGVGDNVVVGDFDNQLLHQQNQQGQQQFDYDFDILGQDFPAFDENQDLELGRHRPSSAATAAYTPLVLRGVEDDGAARPRSSLSLAASLRLARSGVALSSADGSGFPLMLPGGDSAASSSNRRPSGSGRYSDILPRSNNMDDYLFEPLQDATGADILDDHLGSSVDGGCGLVGESFDDDRGTVMSSMLGGAGAGYVGKDGRVYDASASVEKEIVGFFK